MGKSTISMAIFNKFTGGYWLLASGSFPNIP